MGPSDPVLIYIYTYIPKDPGMSQERDYPYNPVAGMGLNHQSYSREGSGFLGYMYTFQIQPLSTSLIMGERALFNDF